MAQCVFNEVGKELHEQVSVTDDRDASRYVDVERPAAVLDIRLIRVGDCLKHIRQINLTKGRAPACDLDLRDAQKGRKRAKKRVDLADRILPLNSVGDAA